MPKDFAGVKMRNNRRHGHHQKEAYGLHGHEQMNMRAQTGNRR